MSDTPTLGCVVEAYGRRVVVTRDDTGERTPCMLRGRKLEIVGGDRVRIERMSGSTEWLVAERLPRRNVLLRSESRGFTESIAANLDQLAIVMAATPACDPFMVDRYVAGALYAGIEPLVVLNKVDLPLSDETQACIAAYAAIGLRVCRVSARTMEGMTELIGQLSGKRTLLAGQSGVGKSSLTNALVGTTRQSVGTLSSGTGEGRHTTVSSSIVTLPWGELVDSPGVRDYAPPIVPLQEVQIGYPEVARRAAGCRFADCQHTREPQCAVRAAAESGEIDPRRYESYRRLLNLTRQLDERRGYRP